METDGIGLIKTLAKRAQGEYVTRAEAAAQEAEGSAEAAAASAVLAQSVFSIAGDVAVGINEDNSVTVVFTKTEE